MTQFNSSCKKDAWRILSRSGKAKQLVKTWIETQICELVTLEEAHSQELIENFTPSPWIDKNDIPYAATFSAKISLFKQVSFAPQVEEYFTNTKSNREKIIFSMLRSSNKSRLHELALSIREGEIDFAAAAIRWSEGPESAKGGKVGPILAAHSGHPELRKQLDGLSDGQFAPLFAIGETHVFLRLDKRISPRLDESMTLQLVDELYQNWLVSQLRCLEDNGRIDPIEYLPA